MGNMYNVGNEGWYWSSTVEDEEYVYYLDFIISNVVPSDSHVARHNGFPLRCHTKKYSRTQTQEYHQNAEILTPSPN